jgi:hypothetical protein
MPRSILRTIWFANRLFVKPLPRLFYVVWTAFLRFWRQTAAEWLKWPKLMFRPILGFYNLFNFRGVQEGILKFNMFSN